MIQNFDDFLWYLSAEKRLSLKTEEAYKNDLQAWAQELGKSIFSVEPPPVEQFRDALEAFHSQNMKSATISRRRSTIRVYAKYRALQDVAWLQVLNWVPSTRAEDTVPKALSREEVVQFLDFTPDPKDPASLRNKALFELLYATGLRSSEALNLEWSQIDERLGGVRVTGKGSKVRFVPFTEECGMSLTTYREAAWPSLVSRFDKRFRDLVFPGARGKPLSRMGLWKIMRRRGLECGIPNLHPHVFRHSFATHLLKGGADVRFVQVMLGHSSLDTTEKYLKIADEELKMIFEKHHPLLKRGRI